MYNGLMGKQIACNVLILASTQVLFTNSASPYLSEKPLEKCYFEIITVDDRELPKYPKLVKPHNYWVISAIVNSAYAARMGYGYTYVTLNASGIRSSRMCNHHSMWGKVYYIAHRLRELATSNKCTWLLFLDSDAFVHEFDARLSAFLGGLGARDKMKRDVSLIIAEDRNLTAPADMQFFPMHPFRTAIPWLNPGVFLVRAGARSRRFFDLWVRAGEAASLQLKRHWPGETAVISELARPGTFKPARCGRHGLQQNVSSAVGIIDMLEMNSPWGRFVAHLWGFHRYRRNVDLWKALMRIGLDGPWGITRSLRALLKHRRTWHPGGRCEGIVGREDMMQMRHTSPMRASFLQGMKKKKAQAHQDIEDTLNLKQLRLENEYITGGVEKITGTS